MTRVRIRFTKDGKVRFTSHRDIARILERVARRAELPLAYSQGFSPRPRLHFGLALPTGCASAGEYADIDLDEPVDLATLPDVLTVHLPPGMEVTAAVEVDPHAPSLQEAVTSCTWRISLPEVAPGDGVAAVQRAMASAALPVTRQRKGNVVTDDIRGGIIELVALSASAGGTEIVTELATRPRGVRPGDLIDALDPSWEPTVIRREHQWIATGDARHEPLASRTDATPHAEVRAS